MLMHINVLMFLQYVLRSYCNTDLHPEHRQMTQLEAIKRYLTGKEPLLQCKCFVKYTCNRLYPS